jgi:large subunit ribosomal protein L21
LFIFEIIYFGGKMFAIIETGGKQYRVEKDDVIDVELLNNSKGNKVAFEKVLLFNDGKNATVGSPIIESCKVFGEIVENQTKGPKVFAYKYKKRKDSKKKVGHRQKYTRIKITEIQAI